MSICLKGRELAAVSPYPSTRLQTRKPQSENTVCSYISVGTRAHAKNLHLGNWGKTNLGSLWATQSDLVSPKRKGKKETKSETRGREGW